MSAEKSAKEILQTVFGYTEFRGHQAAIIDDLIQGQDALVLMPTGGGKSLCYQIPALVRPGVGIVISPLIALMQDQVDALLQWGVKAAFLNSSLDAEGVRRVEQAMLAGELELLYVAPERLMMPRFLDLLEQTRVSLFAIDEAHCVSQWGHDFRPEYVQLSILHERFPMIPRVALTATADEPTRREIVERLGLADARHYTSSFDRPNIRYRIVQKQNTREQLHLFLETEHRGDAGIIYCLSRKRVEEVAQWLSEKGWDAMPYHAGMSNVQRQKNQQRFLREEGCIIVATVAFGMGIDKPNVRFVAHLDLPKSMEGYYQETGRAGRDGLPANAWLSYGLGDVIMLRQMLDTSEADEQHKRLERRKLDALLGFCETTRCRRHVLLHYFGEVYSSASMGCRNCDNCMEPVATWDGKIAAQKALSCVYRTGQRFGVKHLVDVLLGKITPQVERFNHDKVSTFGIGQEYTSLQWHSIYRQLVAANFLAVDMSGYGGLRLTKESQALLRGECTIALRNDPDISKKKVKASAKREQKNSPAGTDVLWQALKNKRLELAREQGVPPYIIFHDSSLIEIHAKKPKTLTEFSYITGVGESKLKRYAVAFIEVVTEIDAIK
jgi:ATP-dependent DNA helicase RecQ